MITSCVRPHNGLPTLFINNRPIYQAAYITYLPERNDYAAFRQVGIHLYSITLYFGRQTINEVSRIHPFAPGIFDKKGEPDFSLADHEIERILAADPEALIFPRVNTALPVWWEKEHPDELNDTGYADGPRRLCFASKKWLDEVTEGLRLLVEHVEASSYRDHIFGYQIGGGNTEEWFSFDQKGEIGLRSRESWERVRREGSIEADFYAHLSQITADAIAHLARKMKQFTHNRLVIGSFYGYTFETPFRHASHAALSRLLGCEELDFLCSPASYAQTRAPGIDHACMTVLDSVLMHGKLYFTEADERTHLTLPLKDCREDSCEPGTYVGGVWKGPDNAFTARHVLRADFARQLVHGNNYWWFDMWGGWYRDEGMMRDIAQEEAILRRSLEDTDRALPAQIAVLMDESCHCLSRNITEGAAAYRFRIPLGSAGFPYAAYEAADFEAVRGKYRGYILIEPAKTERMEQIRAAIAQDGRPMLTICNDTDLSPALFREFARRCGAWIWCETDDVVHAGTHYLAIHAATAGEKRLLLPKVCCIEPQFGEGEPFTADRIDLNLPQYATCLFRITPQATVEG